MKLKAIYFPKNLSHPKVRDLVGENIVTKECAWGSDASENYIDVLSEAGGFDVRLNFTFTNKACDAFTHFLLEPKHILRESDSVYDKNLDYFAEQPVHHQDESGVYRLREKIYVDKVKPMFDRIWCLESADAYLAKSDIVKTMVERFSGVSLVPVLNVKNQEPVADWASFLSSSWLNTFCEDETTQRIVTDAGYQQLRGLGLFSAPSEQLDKLTDVARAPYSDNFGDSGYIVSSPVWQYWQELGVKSFEPRPILVYQSEEYKNYLALFQEVNKRISQNPENSIRV
ncbi:MAG: hypothetical protein MI976_09750 [Pseudomonadales bacterium]|nr:hypothetical protein [Pseudomonadales bacterium]